MSGVTWAAAWGAVTGTASLTLLLWKERRAVRRGVEVRAGWQYAVDPTDDHIFDVWVSVQARATGQRPTSVEFVGFEIKILADREKMREHRGVEWRPDRNLWVRHTAEIALNGEVLELKPDGPFVKVWTRLPPIVARGIDPTDLLVRPYVVTGQEEHWYGPASPFLPRPPRNETQDEVRDALDNLAALEPNRGKLSDVEPGVFGLERLMLEGTTVSSRELAEKWDREASEVADPTTPKVEGLGSF